MLADFYQDVATREAVRQHLQEYVHAEALRAVMSGEETKHFKIANEIIKGAFDALDATFGPKQKSKTENEAR